MLEEQQKLRKKGGDFLFQQLSGKKRVELLSKVKIDGISQLSCDSTFLKFSISPWRGGSLQAGTEGGRVEFQHFSEGRSFWPPLAILEMECVI